MNRWLWLQFRLSSVTPIYNEDVATVIPLLVQNVPAAERCDEEGKYAQPLEMAQLLNAGWILRLSKFGEFRKSLPPAVGEDPVASHRQLHALLLKSFELGEIKRRWVELTAQRQEQSGAS